MILLLNNLKLMETNRRYIPPEIMTGVSARVPSKSRLPHVTWNEQRWVDIFVKSQFPRFWIKYSNIAIQVFLHSFGIQQRMTAGIFFQKEVISSLIEEYATNRRIQLLEWWTSHFLKAITFINMSLIAPSIIVQMFTPVNNSKFLNIPPGVNNWGQSSSSASNEAPLLISNYGSHPIII